VEWRFRSNHPLGQIFFTCDAGFFVKYGGTAEDTRLYGDAVFNQSGNFFVTGLPFNQFHTLRYQSHDGTNFSISVNGKVFVNLTENQPNGFHYIQLRGTGGCSSDQVPNMVNEWDFVRYGTIGSGEQVDSTTPPSGALGPGEYTSFTSFLVTFDQPNYVYVDDISVSVTGGLAPVVTATRRTDTHDEHTVEIVLDRALPSNELTTFTLTDGTSTTDIHYDFRALPAVIPTSSTSSLLTLIIVLTLAAAFILRNRAGVTVQENAACQASA